MFALIGRADPDPKGFAWLATLIGLFETGYISTAGFFDRDVREPISGHRACMCGSPTPSGAARLSADRYGMDLFDGGLLRVG